ncbi:MAG: type II toxin-antitoxin system ParD family antitoxin [Polyangiaceae bacterium]|jgi:antitoxin ParD1/3/4
MPRNTGVTLSDHFEQFVASEVASGRFGNVSEVVRAGRAASTVRGLFLDAPHRIASRERSGRSVYLTVRSAHFCRTYASRRTRAHAEMPTDVHRVRPLFVERRR